MNIWDEISLATSKMENYLIHINLTPCTHTFLWVHHAHKIALFTWDNQLHIAVLCFCEEINLGELVKLYFCLVSL